MSDCFDYKDEFDLSSADCIEKLATAYKSELYKKTVSTQNDDLVSLGQNVLSTKKILMQNIINNLHKQSQTFEYIKKNLNNRTAITIANALIEKAQKNVKCASIICCEASGSIMDKNEFRTFDNPRNFCQAVKSAQNNEAVIIEYLFTLYSSSDSAVIKSQISSIIKERLESTRLLTMLYGDCKHRQYDF